MLKTPKQELRAAATVGQPAKVQWPHRVLHMAIAEIERLEALVIDARYGLKHRFSAPETQTRLIEELDREFDRIKTDKP